MNPATNSTSCSTSRMATPLDSCTDRRVLARSPVSARSRPDEGSSRSSTFGRVISARPTSTSRALPRLRCSIGSSASSRRPRSPSTSSHAATSSAEGRPRPRRSFHSRPVPRRVRSAMSRCSRTVDSENSSMRWKVRPMPSRARSYTGRPLMSLPARCTVPVSGRRIPRTQLKKVVLPAPLGPMRPTRSPGSTLRSTSRRASMPANVFLMPRASSRAVTRRPPRPVRPRHSTGDSASAPAAVRCAHRPAACRAPPAPRDGERTGWWRGRRG